MGKQMNETPVFSRNMGMKYRAEFDSDDYVIYEGWALNPKAATTDTIWQICKHTYDSNGNLTETNWADGSDDFSFAWDSRSDYSYS